MPNPTRGGDTKQLMRQIQYGMSNAPMGGGGMGAMMGFMGLPFQSKGSGAGKGSGGGPFMTFDPRTQTAYQGGMSGVAAASAAAAAARPKTGGELPPVDPNKPVPLPGDKFKLNLIPEWWKEWYRTQGQNGGMPPVDGLL